MTKYINCVFVKHDNNDKPYLFCIETMDKLKQGQRVLCMTMYGDVEGVCVSDSFLLSNDALSNIAKVTGAYLPLKPIKGVVELKPTVEHITKLFGIYSCDDVAF